MYEQNETLSKNVYLFQNNKFSYEYANPFSVANPSNTSVNAFDFAYYTLELFSFIIIIYVIVLGAGMIAGEEANGTMKLLAMRPYKRYKIFLGKVFAALKVGLIFIVIGAIASFITGAYLYGTVSLPILSVFNMEYVIISSPYLMFGVYLFTLFIEILFYTIIAVSISSIFKSYTGAVTISILIYFLSMILSFVAGASFLKFVPLTHTNLFKYFGAAFSGNTSVAGLNSLLTPPILLGSDFIFSVSALSITMVVLLITALKIFSKRDLK
jgi:ABC-2 type transport system permease protein